MTFHGIPLKALDFYEDLEADNSKTYWTARAWLLVYVGVVTACFVTSSILPALLVLWVSGPDVVGEQVREAVAPRRFVLAAERFEEVFRGDLLQRLLRVARQDDDLIPALREVARQRLPDETAPARDDDDA